MIIIILPELHHVIQLLTTCKKSSKVQSAQDKRMRKWGIVISKSCDMHVMSAEQLAYSWCMKCVHFVPDPEMCKGISASMYDSSSSSNSEDDMDIS